MCGTQRRADPGLDDSCSGSSMKMCPRMTLGSPSRPSRAIWWDCLGGEQSDDNIPLIFQSDPSIGFKVKCLLHPWSAFENMVENDSPLFTVPGHLWLPFPHKGSRVFFLLLGHSLQSYRTSTVMSAWPVGHRYTWAHLTRSSPNKIMLDSQKVPAEPSWNHIVLELQQKQNK